PTCPRWGVAVKRPDGTVELIPDRLAWLFAFIRTWTPRLWSHRPAANRFGRIVLGRKPSELVPHEDAIGIWRWAMNFVPCWQAGYRAAVEMGWPDDVIVMARPPDDRVASPPTVL